MHGGSKKSRRVWSKIDALLLAYDRDVRAFGVESEANHRRFMVKVDQYNKQAARILGDVEIGGEILNYKQLSTL